VYTHHIVVSRNKITVPTNYEKILREIRVKNPSSKTQTRSKQTYYYYYIISFITILFLLFVRIIYFNYYYRIIATRPSHRYNYNKRSRRPVSPTNLLHTVAPRRLPNPKTESVRLQNESFNVPSRDQFICPADLQI